MEADRFGSLARFWVTVPRRTAIGLFGGGLAASLALSESDARKRKKRKRRHKNKKPRPPKKPLPTEQLNAHCPESGNSSHIANIPAVTFAARRSGLLTRAQVLLFDSQTGQDFKLVLMPVDADGLPITTFLASEEVLDVPESGHGNPSQRLEATFANPARVIKGQRYALVVVSEQGFRLGLGNPEQCPDSFAFDDTNGDETFTPFPDRDFIFATFVLG